MTTYIPAVSSYITNPLPEGTRIRATLGETSIVGYVSERDHDFPLIDITIEHPDYDPDEEGRFMGGYSLWVDSGWTFEVLEPRA